MKLIPLIALALTAVSPSVAQTNANFTGLHADIGAGFNDIQHARDRNDINYSASVGLDVPVGDRFVVGAEGSADNVFQSTRQYGAAARLGYALTPRWLGYAKVGYEDYHSVYNRRDINGLRAGGGAQFAISPNTYLKAEYRHTFYDGRMGENGALGAVGIRF